MFGETNATKGAILAVVNTLLVLIVAFGVDVSTDQIGAIMAAVNAVAGLYIALTYKKSAKRVADA